MASENTVTIGIEEYFDLRKKAETNIFLLGELARYDERFNQFDERLFRLEGEVRRLRGEN